MFNVQLESWYSSFGRDLPWRHTSDPYLIMLSEFILQQTQISQGMDYYLRFAERFPTAESLAEAGEEEVLRLGRDWVTIAVPVTFMLQRSRLPRQAVSRRITALCGLCRALATTPQQPL